jgi:uncharacterized protein (DUF1778 family)
MTPATPSQDQTTIVLDERQWEEFRAALDAVPADNPKLHALLTRKPAWEDRHSR